MLPLVRAMVLIAAGEGQRLGAITSEIPADAASWR